MSQKSEEMFFCRGGKNTTMEGFGTCSPFCFSPFSPRFEVSEARRSHPLPFHYQCSLIRPGVTLDMSSQCRGIAATEIAGRSWETMTVPRGHLGVKKTLPSHKDTSKGGWRATNTHSALVLSLHPKLYLTLPAPDTESKLA